VLRGSPSVDLDLPVSKVESPHLAVLTPRVAGGQSPMQSLDSRESRGRGP
jgi:hypothetical protein